MTEKRASSNSQMTVVKEMWDKKVSQELGLGQRHIKEVEGQRLGINRNRGELQMTVDKCLKNLGGQEPKMESEGDLNETFNPACVG